MSQVILESYRRIAGGTEEYEKIISWMIANPNMQEVVDHGNPSAGNGFRETLEKPGDPRENRGINQGQY